MKHQRYCYRSPSLRCNPQGVRGFTLLELLVAIMIMTLMMTVAFGAVRLGSRSWEAGIERANASDEVRAVSEFLRRQFAQMISIPTDDNDAMEDIFSGDQIRIRFIAPAPRHSVIAGLIVYTLSAEKFDDSQRLVLSYAPFDPGTGNLPEAQSNQHLILADGFATISFQFFGKKAADSMPSWQEEWPDDEESLPELVRITLISANEAIRWPELVLKIFAAEQS